jgi:hypothetical protein
MIHISDIKLQIPYFIFVKKTENRYELKKDLLFFIANSVVRPSSVNEAILSKSVAVHTTSFRIGFVCFLQVHLACDDHTSLDNGEPHVSSERTIRTFFKENDDGKPRKLVFYRSRDFELYMFILRI